MGEGERKREGEGEKGWRVGRRGGERERGAGITNKKVTKTQDSLKVYKDVTHCHVHSSMVMTIKAHT